jgi:putative two-component system response regulator
MLPGMDGFEVCRRLRAERGLVEIPILMITALSDRASRLEGINAGADDFISKPFDRELLLARVRTIARLNRYRKLHEQSAELAQVNNKLEQEVAVRRRLEARLREYETRLGART